MITHTRSIQLPTQGHVSGDVGLISNRVQVQRLAPNDVSKINRQDSEYLDNLSSKTTVALIATNCMTRTALRGEDVKCQFRIGIFIRQSCVWTNIPC